MTTATRTSPASILQLDSSGGPLEPSTSIDGRPTNGGVPGLHRAARVARVQDVEPVRSAGRLAWGIADGRTLLFEVDEETAREFRASLDAGEEPTAIVEPGRIVAMDLERRPGATSETR